MGGSKARRDGGGAAGRELEPESAGEMPESAPQEGVNSDRQPIRDTEPPASLDAPTERKIPAMIPDWATDPGATGPAITYADELSPIDPLDADSDGEEEATSEASEVAPRIWEIARDACEMASGPGENAPPVEEDAPGAGDVARNHLRGLVEALIFVSDRPIRATELAKATAAPLKEIKELLGSMVDEYSGRGIQLGEVAGGWIFRTNPAYAPFVRDLTKQKPVKLTRAQIETLAILAYRQPITRPEIDDIRGVDSGPVLKVLLERELIKILGKKDEPGRPLIYGTTPHFLEFFGLKALRDMPTLREFTELNEDSQRVVERELGEVLASRDPAEGHYESPSLVPESGEVRREFARPPEDALAATDERPTIPLPEDPEDGGVDLDWSTQKGSNDEPAP